MTYKLIAVIAYIGSIAVVIADLYIWKYRFGKVLSELIDCNNKNIVCIETQNKNQEKILENQMLLKDISKMQDEIIARTQTKVDDHRTDCLKNHYDNLDKIVVLENNGHKVKNESTKSKEKK